MTGGQRTRVSLTSMHISLATIDDAAAILDLQHRAYQSEAAIYDDFSLPPLLETLAQLRDQFPDKCFLKATEDDHIVGSVRGFHTASTCHVERLIVDPEYRKRGIGTALLQQIEVAHLSATRFELFTGHKSVNNIRLYQRRGYRPFRREVVSQKVTLVFLEKTAAP